MYCSQEWKIRIIINLILWLSYLRLNFSLDSRGYLRSFDRIVYKELKMQIILFYKNYIDWHFCLFPCVLKRYFVIPWSASRLENSMVFKKRGLLLLKLNFLKTIFIMKQLMKDQHFIECFIYQTPILRYLHVLSHLTLWRRFSLFL